MLKFLFTEELSTVRYAAAAWCGLLGWVVTLNGVAGYRYRDLAMAIPVSTPEPPPPPPSPSSTSATPKPPGQIPSDPSGSEPTPSKPIPPKSTPSDLPSPPRKTPIVEPPPMILARRLAVIVLSSEETQHDDAWEELNESLSKVVQAYGPDLLEKEVYIAGPHGVRSWPAKHDPSYKFFTLSQLSDAVQIGCDYVSERIAKPSQSYTLLFIWCGNEHPDFEESLQVGKLRGAVDSHATLKAYLAWCGPGSTQKSSKFQQAFPNQLWLMRSSDDLRNTITYELKAPR